jgi:tripartite-type tricarboxylate transporter receptor subunit TctC
MVTRRQFTFTAAASAMVAAVPSIPFAATKNVEAVAQNGDIRIIVPFAKSGPTDKIAQFIAPHLAKALNNNVAVDYITGDWGMTAAKLASIAQPDGRTLIMGNLATHAALPALKNRYDALNGFTPIGLVGVSPMVVLVRADLPLNSLTTLQAYLKASPNVLAISQGGLGSASAIATVKFKRALGVTDLRERVYTGTAAALDDLMNGKADILIDQMITALPAIRSGKVKAVGIASTSRNIMLPDVYTGTQQGFSDFRASNWNALFAPKGMKADLQNALASGLDAVLNDAAVTREMRERGLHVPFIEQRGPEALARLQLREMWDMRALLLNDPTPALV